MAGALFATVLSDTKQPPSLPLEVEFAGCASVRVSAAASDDRVICDIPEGGALRLWASAPPGARLMASVDGRAQAATGRPLQAGLAFDLIIPDGARELALMAAKDAAVGWFQLRLASRAQVPALDEAEKRRQAGRLEEAESLVKPLLGDPSPLVRARAMGKLARIERRQGRTDRAITLLREAMDLDRQAGLISDAVEDGLLLSLTLREKGRRYGEARAALDAIEPQLSRFPEGRAMAPHYRALLFSAVGDLRAALRLFDASEKLSERLGLDAHHRVDVLQQKADVLSMLGRHGEARALLKAAGALLEQVPSPCAKAQWENNIAWSHIVAREAKSDGASTPDLTAPLERALELYRTTCADPVEASRALVNLSHAKLLQGRIAEARRDLEASRSTAPHPGSRLEAWWLTLDARLALAEGRPAEALSRSRELRRLADAEGLQEPRVEAASGEAKALDALGQVGAARRAYAEADALLETWSLRAPLGEGRDGFVASREAVTRGRVSFLLRQAEHDADPSPWYGEAATAARLARARVLASLRSVERIGALPAPERERWEQALERYRQQRDQLAAKAVAARDLPADALKAFAAKRAAAQAKLDADFEQALSSAGVESIGSASLSPIAPGEVLLIQYPLDEGWAAFAITQSATAARRISAPDATTPPEQLSAQILEPFGPLIEGAQMIRFAPYGPLLRVDLHALPWHGAPLLQRHSIVYPIDLATRARVGPTVGDARLAIIVADPRSDLPAARSEASAVAAALAHHGWRTQVLRGEQATVEAVRRALESPETRLLHYAGHGSAAGWDGWQSALALADGELRIPDLLALHRVAPFIVLSACDTAATNDRVPVEGLGVGQAFVLAGAAAVVATVRPVDDRLSRRLMSHLYSGDNQGSLLDLATALRAAQLAVARSATPDGWVSFRILGP